MRHYIRGTNYTPHFNSLKEYQEWAFRGQSLPQAAQQHSTSGERENNAKPKNGFLANKWHSMKECLTRLCKGE